VLSPRSRGWWFASPFSSVSATSGRWPCGWACADGWPRSSHLSVLALLFAIRYLALYGAPEAALRPARRLLLLASLLTLALNVTEPLLVGMYGRAAFDAVGPLLLIGWAEVGPGLLQAISGIRAVTNAAPTLPRSSFVPR
jgi:hypothetical protein